MSPQPRPDRPVRHRAARSGGRRRPTVLFAVTALVGGLLVGGGLITGLGVAQAAAGQRIDLRALVVDDGSVWVKGVSDQFTMEGVPFTTVTLTSATRPVITSAFLSSGTEGHYDAVVLPDDLGGGLPAPELTALAAYEAAFGVRQVDAYNWANPTVGLNYAASPGYIGDLTGMTGTLTPAGQVAGFGYLSGTVPIGTGSYGYLATPAGPGVIPAGGTFTPLVTVPIPGGTGVGSLVGVYANAGVQKLIITAAMSTTLSHWRLLAHGIVSWVTQGIHFGYNRNYFTMHFDDAFNYDGRWDSVHHCTPGEDCPAGTAATPDIRMSAADVATVVAWVKANGYTPTLAFNSYYSVYDINGSPWNGTDPLTNALVANRSSFSWLNHGYQHIFQGCVQNFTVIPWFCTTTNGLAVAANGSNISWVPQASIASEISNNVARGKALGLAFDPSEYLSGEHSGLYILPQQPIDNPNFTAAVSAAGIRAIGADASREPVSRPVGSALTVPRHPTAIYYNASTQAEEVNEYNWIYSSVADGGSGYCSANPATATCLAAPLSSTNGFTSYIVPTDSAYDLRFALSNDPRPFYGHVSNLTAPDYLGLQLVSAILTTYRTSFTAATPLVNQTMTQAGDILSKQQTWATAGMGAAPTVTGYLQNGVVTVTNTGSAAAPLTVPTGTRVNGAAFGASYGGENSGWVTGNVNASLAGITSAAAATFTVGTAGTFSVTTSSTLGVPKLTETGALPAGVTLIDGGNGTATLAGTPAAGTAGSYPLTLTAAVGSAVVTQAFVLTVRQLPAFTSAATYAAPAGAAFSFPITTTGLPAATLTEAGALPTGVTFTAGATGTATISGTTTAAAGTTYPITISATNAVGVTTQSFTLVLSRGPAITSSATGAPTVGTAFSKRLRSTGSPTPTLAVTGVLPAGITFVNGGNGTGTLTGTPTAGTGGVYQLTLVATNAAGAASQALTLTVAQAPAITSPATLALSLNKAFSFTVTTTGYPTAQTSWDAGDLPDGVNWVDNPNGTATISGTPTTSGTYVETVNAWNDTDSVFQTLTVTVT